MTGRNGMIDMGHGQSVEVMDGGEDGVWVLRFSSEGQSNSKAPNLSDIQVDAIHPDAIVRSLELSPGDDPATVIARGNTKGAYRARVMIKHGDHFHEREENLLGAEDPPIRLGPHGGSQVSLHDDHIEVVRQKDRLEVHFTSGGNPINAPNVESVTAESVRDHSEDFQVNGLLAIAGGSQSTVRLSGRVADAKYVRIVINGDEGRMIRVVPLTGAQ